ncbi:MAG: pimeloyl-CoA dehydrogenase small subunit [Alphaproteobacteria bacterium]|nr:pimeloyl-CoA dehydrogenase small subunit [Alphaproteobacteria bacterium]
MDLSLSEEQQLLKDQVERFAREAYAFETRRRVLRSEAGFEPAHWKQFAELGWLGVAFAEADGGLGGGPVETGIIMEAFGRGLVLEPFLPNVVLGGGALALAGDDAQKKALLPDLIAGKTKLALAYAERQSRYDLADCLTQAAADGGGFVVSGHKAVVYGGNLADHFVVVARTKGNQRAKTGLSLFLVPRTAKGLTVRGYRTVDGLGAADLALDKVRVEKSAVLGPLDGGLALLERVVDHGIAAICSEAVGAMAVLTDMTVQYSKTRKQFGRPIGGFQVLQHRMVDMTIAVEEARSMALYGTLHLDERNAKTRKRALSATKVQIGRSARLVGQEAVQIHGGMGMTDELAVGHYFKRLTMIDVAFGNADWHQRRFADLS